MVLRPNLWHWLRYIAPATADFVAPASNPLLTKEIRQTPAIVEFLFRPYVNRYWTCSNRINSIQSHYLIIHELFPHLDIDNRHHIDIYHMELDLGNLRVVIDRPQWMRREGELGISLFWGYDRIYTAMILFGRCDDHEVYLTIGNLQGDGRSRADLYKYLTKSLHGMRPRDFLIAVVKIFAHFHDCKMLFCISDDAHRSTHWLSRAKKVTGYDAIWLENGAIKESTDGFFRIPTSLHKRTEKEIPTRKRAQYRRRYQLLDDLQSKVEGYFQNMVENKLKNPSRELESTSQP